MSPQREARLTGILYLLNLLTGIAAMVLLGRHLQGAGNAANLVASVLYTAVTLLLGHLLLPVNPWISSVAAVFSLLGCWLPFLHAMPAGITNFAFFGVYCLLIGYLILRSRYMPNVVGVGMICAGLAWLTTLTPRLNHALGPVPMIVGLLGEGTLIAYLLLYGLDARQWEGRTRAQA